MAIATHYLPVQHHLLEKFQETHEEIGLKFFDVSTTSLQRRNTESRAYSLELVELMLVRAHFLTLSKTDSEEIWHVRGELITIGTAMGLHRDPGKWRMHRDVAERRRWAWWHIILLERSVIKQSFTHTYLKDSQMASIYVWKANNYFFASFRHPTALLL